MTVDWEVLRHRRHRPIQIGTSRHQSLSFKGGSPGPLGLTVPGIIYADILIVFLPLQLKTMYLERNDVTG